MKETNVIIEPTIKGMTWVAPRLVWLRENIWYFALGIFLLIIIFFVGWLFYREMKHG